MQKDLGRKKYSSIIQVTIFVLCISSVCAATVQEFNDINEFEVAAGVQQYFIDFETYGDGTPVPPGDVPVNGDEWLNLGIQFAAIEIGDSLILSAKPGMNVSPTGAPGHALAVLNPSEDRCSFLITFSTPVTSFGVYIVDNETNSPTERIILKDKNGNVLGDFAMPGGAGPAPPLPVAHDFIGYSSTIPIAEVNIIENFDGEGVLLDNVMYSVPILLLSPNGGENLISGHTYEITWVTAGDINDVNIIYSTNNGQDWNDVNTVANTGTYEWLVPEVTSNQCLVRISDVCDPNIYDTSDDVFTIFQCVVPIQGDLNGDCYVDFKDFAIVARDWLKCGNPFDDCCYNWILNPETGHHYAITRNYSNWVDAEAEAAALGGHLVTINDANEHAWLGLEFEQQLDEDNYLWIGFYQDHNDPCYSEPGGGWKWISGEPVTYLGWDSPEPTNSPPGEDYGTLTSSLTNHWNDWGPDSSDYHPIRGIIEVPW